MISKTSDKYVGGGRIGYAMCPRSFLLSALGAPSWDASRDGASVDGKVTISWKYETPRGLAEIRDYWWNGPEEWSLAAENRKAGMWLARHLRRLGIQATTKRTVLQ